MIKIQNRIQIQLNNFLQNFAQKMKRQFVTPLSQIQKRANAKFVDMNGRYFLIGGMTITKNTCDIFEFRLTNPQQSKYQVEWRPLKYQNHVFTPRNSFSSCASDSKLYIWGGLESNQKQMTQKCFSDLIEVDIQKGRMRFLPLKQKIQIHSACLSYDKKSNSLIAFGGTNQNSSLEAFLYTLQLDIQQGAQYEWKKKSIKNATTEGVLWQHSCNIYQTSILNKKQGQFMLLAGGCKFPWSPYKTITQIDLATFQINDSLQLQQAVVAHESIYDLKSHCVYIVGGANGGGFNQWIHKIQDGKIQKIQGHNAVGGACVLTQFGLAVFGGVCGPQMLNGMIIYH